jgi:Host cell surface-exposed lipoprotein.
MKAFSRNGLIQQLSSDAGDSYKISDASVAMYNLNIDWNQEAVKSAKQYLNMKGFSCKGLIQQLTSCAGYTYPVDQATYGQNRQVAAKKRCGLSDGYPRTTEFSATNLRRRR